MVVSIWVTNDCNMHCDYCYVGEKGILNLSLQDYDYIETFIYRAHERNKEDNIYIKFFGGEPLLNFEFLKYFIEHFKSENVIYSVTTNGTLLTGEKLDFLVKNNVELFVSVDGGEKIHDNHRKLKSGIGSWNVIKKNLFKVLEKNRNIKVRMTYTPETVCALTDSIKQISELGIKSIHLCPDYFSQNWNTENLAILRQEFTKIIELRKRLPDIEISTGNYKETINKDCSRCGGGENIFSISTEGDIYPCTYAVGIEKFRIGSIFNLEKIKWGSYLVDASSRKLCKGCKYFKVCYSGRCIYLNYKMTENLYIPNGFFCAYQKMEYKLVEDGCYD